LTLSLIKIPHPPQDGKAVAAFGFLEFLPDTFGELTPAVEVGGFLPEDEVDVRFACAITAWVLPLTMV